MASHNTSHHNKGFSLAEALIVLAITAVILGFGLSVDLNYYKSSLFRSERSVLVSILERARSRAMNNYYESPHGVCYIAPNYIIFRGTACVPGAGTNELIQASSDVAITGLSQTDIVVFEQLSGRATAHTVTVTEHGKSSNISINAEGTINW